MNNIKIVFIAALLSVFGLKNVLVGQSLPDSLLLVKYETHRDSQTYAPYVEENIELLASIAEPMPPQAAEKFILADKDLTSFISGYYTMARLSSYLFELDIDGDGDKDVIYQGGTNGEPFITKIYLNDKGSYTKIFETYQYIFELAFAKKKISKIAIANPGCCSDSQMLDYYYRVKIKKGVFTFERERTIGYMRIMEAAKQKYKQPKSFSIVDTTAELRMECFELDIEHPFYGEDGNTIATYKKSDKGIALAHKIQDGVVWVFVLMNEKTDLLQTSWTTFQEQPTALYGWIRKNQTNLK